MKTEMLIGAAAVGLMSLLAACSSATGATANSASIENSCINPTEITKQTIVSDQEIQFELRNGETWVNKLPRACFGLKLQGGFSWDVHGTQVCSNQETIKVLNDGTTCQLGAFSRVSAGS